MNTKNIILFGVGFLTGYVLLKYVAKKNLLNSNEKAFSDTSSQTEPPKVVNPELKDSEVKEESVDPKISACKEKWSKFSSTIRFGSEQQMQSTYNNFMTTCVAQS